MPSRDLEITLVTGAVAEAHVRDALERLRQDYDLEPFESTMFVRIEQGAIPHSHPVLTLSDRYDGGDDRLLATYLHEQLHWWSMACPGALDGRDETIYERLRTDFPLPIEPPEGCGDEFSNLIHLHVCWLELEALTHLIGEGRSVAVLRSLDHYRAVYRTVIAERAELGRRFNAAGMGVADL